jgi:hypothetical protein
LFRFFHSLGVLSISESGVHPKDIWKREGVKEIMDARHTVMGFFSDAVEREIHRFVWTCYSFVVL